MTTKKYPISLNDEDQKILRELINLLSLNNIYGNVPQTIKFGIRLALSTLKNPQKVYSELNPDNLDVYFSSIKQAELLQRNQKKAGELLKSTEND